MPKNKGFTLIEVLLVVALIAIMASTVVFSLPDNNRDEAEQQAKSLWLRLQLLNEEAMLSGRDYGLRIDSTKNRYFLQQLESEGWQPLQLDRLPYETELVKPLKFEFNLGGSAWQDQDRLFNPTSLFDEEMFADLEEEKELPEPQVFVMSSGEVTPFSIAIYPEDADAEETAWHVVAKENGQIVLLQPGEQEEFADVQ